MSHSDFLIKNCSAKDFESACPKHWDELRPAFSDMVRHCDHCNKKVYLCETDEQISFYTSVKFCIAVAPPEGLLNVEGNTPTSRAVVSHAVKPAAQHDNGVMTSIIRPVPNVWRRPLPSEPRKEVQYDDIGSSSRMQQVTDDTDIPAFLRKQKN
jgi:hypothetical protein